MYYLAPILSLGEFGNFVKHNAYYLAVFEKIFNPEAKCQFEQLLANSPQQQQYLKFKKSFTNSITQDLHTDILV